MRPTTTDRVAWSVSQSLSIIRAHKHIAGGHETKRGVSGYKSGLFSIMVF